MDYFSQDLHQTNKKGQLILILVGLFSVLD